MSDGTGSTPSGATPPETAPRTRVRLRDFSRSLPMALLRAREAVMRHFRQHLRDHNLTEQQWRVLRALNTVPKVEIGDLARATFLLSPSLSRIVRDLEARDLVVRTPDAADQRRAFLTIAPAGVDLIEAIGPQSEAIYARITGRFGAERLALLQDLLRDLEQELTAADFEPGED